MAPSEASAGFNYVAPQSARASFAAVGETNSLARTLGRLAPEGLRVRYDRRVDQRRPIGRSYGDWQSLLWGEGLGGDLHGEELHVRPAGVAPGKAELLSAERGRRDWEIEAGEKLFDVLRRWGGRAGVHIAVLTDRTWRLGGAHVFRQRTFDEACAALLIGLSHMPHPPAAERDGDVLSVMHRVRNGGAAR